MSDLCLANQSVLPTAVTILITAAISVAGFLLNRWYHRRGAVRFLVNDRGCGEYVTRGRWDVERQGVIQDAPRFMNFDIPLTIVNGKGVDLTIRVGYVWFTQRRPILKGDEWELPGTSLEPVGVRVKNAAGEIVDPITIPKHSIASIRIDGTSTTPACHAGPFMDWRYVFIQWTTEPVRIPPFVYEIEQLGNGRTFDPTIEPHFPLPSHYPRMQARGSVPDQAIPYSWTE